MGLLNLLTDPKNFKFYNGGQGYTGNGSVPNLKNIPYGKDRIDGGSSNQPYIQTPIPDRTNTLGILNSDFIWRGGIGAPLNSTQDVERLSKMFADTKTPNGLFFITKQETLSRSAVRTQVSPNGINGGVYSPTNTLLQAGVLFTGGHLPKQGINPFAGTGAYSNNDNLYGVRVNSTQPKENNRLVQLYGLSSGKTPDALGFKLNDKLNGFILDNGINVLSYSGGPGSKLGVGTTNIRYTDQRTGENNPLASTNPAWFKGYFENPKTGERFPTKQITPGQYLINLSSTDENASFIIFDRGASGKYVRLTRAINENSFINNYFSLDGKQYGTFNHSVYEPATEGNTWPNNTELINAQGAYTYTQQDIIDTPITPGKLSFSPEAQDFRAILRDNKLSQNGLLTKDQAIVSGQLASSLSYNIADNQTIEGRVNLGNPGARANNNYSDYSVGLTDYGYVNPKLLGTNNKGSLNVLKPLGLDKINSLPIYRSEGPDTSGDTNDLVKFRIAIIDNDTPTLKQYIHFRAFLDSISDSYDAQWSPVKYLGRGENFYTYDGFTRQISLSWTVAAQSKPELIPMYKKLNYLASSLTPSYSTNGYMRGNLAQLTIGGYVFEQPGIITGFDYTMDENTPWEIGIGTEGKDKEDGTVKELAHVIKVSGFNFIPIHTFRPEIQKLQYQNELAKEKEGSVGFAKPGTYGPQRYISIANGEGEENSNYNYKNTNTKEKDELLRP